MSEALRVALRNYLMVAHGNLVSAKDCVDGETENRIDELISEIENLLEE